MKEFFIGGLLYVSGYFGQAQEVQSVTVSINQPTTCELVLSVNLNALETPFRIYPIPTDQQFIVETEEILEEIRLLDLKGSEVLRFNPKSSRQEIKVSNLPKGIYIIRLQTVEKFYQYQILIGNE